MFSPQVLQAAAKLSELCLQRQIRIVTAESCTGGLIAAAMTALPGSSQVVDGGLVTYSNESKMSLLEVSGELIQQQGAVSEAVALAMAAGALHRAGGRAQLSIAVTGVAGPGGGTPGKPVGRVHVAVAMQATPPVDRQQSGETDAGVADAIDLRHEQHDFVGMSRDAVRQQTVIAALHLAATCCG
jgi:nicotinamide-nucleotide amidase